MYLSDFGLAKPAAATRALTRQGSIVARASSTWRPSRSSNQRRRRTRRHIRARMPAVRGAHRGGPVCQLGRRARPRWPTSTRRSAVARRSAPDAASRVRRCGDAERWRRIRANAIRRPATSARRRSWPPAACGGRGMVRRRNRGRGSVPGRERLPRPAARVARAAGCGSSATGGGGRADRRAEPGSMGDPDRLLGDRLRGHARRAERHLNPLTLSGPSPLV